MLFNLIWGQDLAILNQIERHCYVILCCLFDQSGHTVLKKSLYTQTVNNLVMNTYCYRERLNIVHFTEALILDMLMYKMGFSRQGCSCKVSLINVEF